MKFCAVICEYNPFHNGHKYQLDEIREKSGCDKILCVMSGNFTQSGEAAVFDKYTRARHAVENGADAVIELPAAFAVAPAEIFAEGAVRLISSVPAVSALAFGCESGTAQSFLAAANAMRSEDKQLKAAIKENMKDGTSYVRARTQAVLKFNADIDEALLTSPNNILGVEYCRALLNAGGKIAPFPIPRVGGGYADGELKPDFSSATALRAAMHEEKTPVRALKRNLPESVLDDVLNFTPFPYGKVALSALVTAKNEEIAETADCSEGLENRLKALTRSNPEYAEMLKKATTKRYTLSRLKRILAQNLLGLKLKELKEFLSASLYLKTLAIEKSDAENILAELAKSSFPVIARKSDAIALKKSALACFEKDVRGVDLYNVLTGSTTNEYETLFVTRTETKKKKEKKK